MYKRVYISSIIYVVSGGGGVRGIYPGQIFRSTKPI